MGAFSAFSAPSCGRRTERAARRRRRFWFRIDRQPLSGVLLEGWLPAADARHLVAVSCDEESSVDRTVLALAVPRGVELHVCRPEEVAAAIENLDGGAFIVYSSCTDALKASDAGLAMPEVNVGSLCTGFSWTSGGGFSEADAKALETLEARGTVFDFRTIPTEYPQIMRMVSEDSVMPHARRLLFLGRRAILNEKFRLAWFCLGFAFGGFLCRFL